MRALPPHAVPEHDPIAIVGMSGRFPGAPSADALWRLLEEGRESVGLAPPDRPWMHDLYDLRPRTPGRIPTNRGGFLEVIDRFDAGFFDISPREAARMDPQLRILLETAHETLEDAGIPSSVLGQQPTGVFVGSCYNDYWLRHIAAPDEIDFYTELGAASRSAHSGRLAYAFNLRGPAVSVDTACSSSLLSVHLACQSLRAGECDAALAGGVNVILTPYTSLAFAWAGGLSPDGSCRFADAAANGFVRSEGAGLVLLKPLRRALEDGDRIRAVIRGSAVSNNGFSGIGIAAPTVEGQRDAIRRAYQHARLDAGEVAFVEAHGTGTPLGDSTELKALALEMGGRRGEPFVVASVKANIGHTEAAAGVAGLIKAVLTLERRRVPGHPHLGTPNPAVDWEAAPFRVSKETTELPREGELLAGVNSLGASGTNVHMVVASAPPAEGRPGGRRGAHLLALSARSAGALRDLAAAHRERLLGGDPPDLGELCAAAARRRAHHEWRLAVACDSAAELAEALEDVSVTESAADRPRVVFVFPGQGGQWPGMGRELLEVEGVFRSTLARCAEIIEGETGWSLLDALRGEDASWQERTAYVQPALWAMGAALADQWRAWGIAPDAVLGQSQGEIAAAYCAGALTLEQAGHLSCLRARLIDELAPRGAMAWIALPHKEAVELLAEFGIDAQVAVAESPVSAVLAGAPGEIARLLEACRERGVECRPVPVAYAAHSAQIDPVRAPLHDGLKGLAPSASWVPFLSTVTGGVLPGTDLDGDYWWRNLRETVLLEPVIAAQCGAEPVVFLQMSPHPVLTHAIRSSAEGAVSVLESLRRGQPELRTMLDSLGRLYEEGFRPDWEVLNPWGGSPGVLPAYPWQRERHWYQAEHYPYPPIGADPSAAGGGSPAPPLTAAGPTAAGSPPVLDLVRDEFLLDHRVGTLSVMPGAGFLELFADGAGPGAELAQVVFQEMLPLDAVLPPELRIRSEGSDGVLRLSVESRTGDGWKCHAMAVAGAAARREVSAARAERPEAVRRRCRIHLSGEDFYRAYSGGLNRWEGAFRAVQELWHSAEGDGRGEVLARIADRSDHGRRLHPAFLDACLQPLAVLMRAPDGAGFVLTAVDRVRVHLPLEGEVWAHARITHSGPDSVSADITVSDAEGRIIVELDGLHSKVLPSAARQQEASAQVEAGYGVWEHSLRWEPARLPEPVAETGNCLLLGSGGRLERRLLRALTQAGGTVTAATLDAYVPELLEEACEDGPLDAVVCVFDGAVPDDVQAEAVRLCASATEVVRALADSPARLVLVTRGARQTGEKDGCPAPWQAALWGLGLVAGREHPGLAVLLADLDEGGDPREDAAHLTRLMQARTPESQVALRDGAFLSPRLTDTAPDAEAGPLELFTEGGLDGLRLIPAARNREPGPGEIEIEVTHAGLNYHDVLAAVGADGDAVAGPPPLGCEATGTVVRVGVDVPDFMVGDRVMAFSYPAVRTHLTIAGHLAARVPDRLSPAEAATLPAAYATAYHALVERARLAPGERVLIHSATGGVGLAAISIARMCGATVYATAGTPAKRELLQRLGVEKVADSRTTDFTDTFSEGVDVVLGTLVGEGLEAGFAVLKPFGRYLDLSINDIASGRALPMNVFSSSRSYLPVNLLDLYRHNPRHLGELIRTVASLVGDGTLEPPATRVFPATEATEAFTLMARSAHIGKIALALPRDTAEPVQIRADATYLVTGGLSGVGGLFAEWLIQQGAQHLLLIGRSDLTDLPFGDRRAVLLRQLRAGGCAIEYAAVDVADQEEMAELLRRRDREGLPPVAGVVHAAAVLTPTPVTDLDAGDLEATLHPKVAGGWALHQLFADHPLDFFTLFSSAVSVFGGLTTGHHLGAYAAANTFTDALAAHRRSAGLPATVVNWGYWSEVGIAARLSEANGHDVRPQGMGPILLEDAPGLFALMLQGQGQHLLFPPIDWDRYLAAYPSDADNPLLHGPSLPTGRTDSEHARADGQRGDPAAGGRTTAPPQRHGTAVNESQAPPAPAHRALSAAAAPTAVGEVAQCATCSQQDDVRPGPGETATSAAPPSPPTVITDRHRPMTTPGPRTAPGPSPQADAPKDRPSVGNTASTRPSESVPPAQDASAVENALATHLATILGTDPAQLNRSRPLNRLGLDSLMAVELVTRMRRDLGLEIPVARLLGPESLRKLAVALTLHDTPERT